MRKNEIFTFMSFYMIKKDESMRIIKLKQAGMSNYRIYDAFYKGSAYRGKT